MRNYADRSTETKSQLVPLHSPGQAAGRSAYPLEDNRPASVLQQKQMNALKTTQPPGSTIQRFLYVGKGSAKPIKQDHILLYDDEEPGDVPEAVIDRIWPALKAKGKDYVDFFKIQVLTERAFPLRISSWDELTADRIVEFYNQEVKGGLDKELPANFKPGDKLYGIHDVKADKGGTARPNVGRSPQMSELYKILEQAGKQKNVIIDTINNILGISAAKEVEPKTITDTEALNYLEFISRHPRYGPKFKDANADIKKSCKAALEYITSVSGSTVHFELSGIDLAQIASKTDGSVTGAELRSIFRRVVRGGWKAGSPGINPGNIKFYKFGKQVKAPWDTEPELWDAYAKKILAKNTAVERPGAEKAAEKKSAKDELKDDKK